MARKVGMSRPDKSQDPIRWEDYFGPDEKLLWEGAPAGGIRFSFMSAIFSVFGLVFTAIPVFALTVVSFDFGGMVDIFVYGFVGMFVLAGLTFVIAPWLVDAYMRNNTRYALTNKRAFIASTAFGPNLNSYPASSDAPLELINGNLDTVNFANSASGTAEILMGPQRRATPQNTRPVGFRLIKDGRTVYNLLAEIRKESP